MQRFACLTTEETLGDESEKSIEEFTGVMFGARKPHPISDYRYQVFEKTYSPKDDKKPLSQRKGIDASTLPPCKKVLKQKMERAGFVARM